MPPSAIPVSIDRGRDGHRTSPQDAGDAWAAAVSALPVNSRRISNGTEPSKPTWEFPPASSSLQFPANLLQAGIGTKVGFLIESFCLDTISGLFLALSSSNCFTTRFTASLQMVDKCLRMERSFRGSTFDPSSAKLVDASILCLDR